ncbi:DNA topology modulation protein FlaR [Clostridiaceae bacterium DONG20-135]|uniref:DNA topology modulation protein FlaR n=1 Tax=Copranaerobaculum intestinale TaxID=2692629 RepID=A0A6N8UDP6_9FIRM|nr:DNA topology modulation protein FlaR [Copranaerobaculum intestinale]MXQ73557.1 DNA topology modulation protein FlaR [Copranaerobaculum intestinale]
MKIHIIGASGSGKSTLAGNLSKLLQIPHYDLDDIFWDNTQKTYGVTMPLAKRSRIFHSILLQDAWIIEGIYTSWIQESLQQADHIILLDISLASCRWHVMKRFFRRKLGLEKSKRESLKSLVKLLYWMSGDHLSKQEYFAMIEERFPLKTEHLRTAQQIEEMIIGFENGS